MSMRFELAEGIDTAERLGRCGPGLAERLGQAKR